MELQGLVQGQFGPRGLNPRETSVSKPANYKTLTRDFRDYLLLLKVTTVKPKYPDINNNMEKNVFIFELWLFVYNY